MQDADRIQRAHLVGQEFLPGRGFRAGGIGGFLGGLRRFLGGLLRIFLRLFLLVLGQAATLGQQQGQGAGGGRPFEE
ncbi:hypothetical protein D3C80_2099740 [compost metagenome]